MSIALFAQEPSIDTLFTLSEDSTEVVNNTLDTLTYTPKPTEPITRYTGYHYIPTTKSSTSSHSQSQGEGILRHHSGKIHSDNCAQKDATSAQEHTRSRNKVQQ